MTGGLFDPKQPLTKVVRKIALRALIVEFLKELISRNLQFRHLRLCQRGTVPGLGGDLFCAVSSFSFCRKRGFDLTKLTFRASLPGSIDTMKGGPTGDHERNSCPLANRSCNPLYQLSNHRATSILPCASGPAVLPVR